MHQGIVSMHGSSFNAGNQVNLLCSVAAGPCACLPNSLVCYACIAGTSSNAQQAAATPEAPTAPAAAASRPAVLPNQAGPSRQAAAEREATPAAAATARSASQEQRLPQPKLPMCPMCKKERAGHIIIDCRHLGPCQECVPAQERIELYPVCLKCGAKVTAMHRVFLS